MAKRMVCKGFTISERVNGSFHVKYTSKGFGKTWSADVPDFAAAGEWVWNMADNHDIGRKESSGKYYASFRLILEKYTKVQIDSMQRGGTEDEKDFCYHLISDLVGFLKYDRPFYKEFALVVNCDSFFPMMIKAVSE